ncbi:cytochrome d ubiquinol oxidase subunit II [Chryseobacterium sp. T1]
MIYVVIIFLWVSICLYLILGGADFGAGIVELFSHRKHREKTNKIMYESIAPIWEANHMWLIIAIVILFVGFPTIYTTASVYLHIPLVLMLIGIIARGTAFTFRHYDVVEDDWQKVYTHIFYYSSLLTPFFLGIIGASTVSGSINPDANNFLDLYIFSWFNWFGVSVGLFTVSICSYLASIYSLNEVSEASDVRLMQDTTYKTMWTVVITGALVFVTSYFSGIPLLEWIFSKPLGIAAISLSTISLYFTILGIKNKRFKIIRVFAAFQIIMILVAATYQHNPNVIVLGNGSHLSLFDAAAAPKAIASLAWALMLGSLFILPFLFYLMFSFSNKKEKNKL